MDRLGCYPISQFWARIGRAVKLFIPINWKDLEGTYWIIWIPVDLHDQVPEGDWFCPFCVKEQRRATKAKAVPKVKAKAREVMERVMPS